MLQEKIFATVVRYGKIDAMINLGAPPGSILHALRYNGSKKYEVEACAFCTSSKSCEECEYGKRFGICKEGNSWASAYMKVLEWKRKECAREEAAKLIRELVFHSLEWLSEVATCKV